MKKLYSIFIGLISFASFGQTIYSENMGTPTGNTAVATYVTGTAPATFQNGSPIVYTGTSGANMMRVSTASSGYTGASGNGNVFFNQTTNVGHFFQIDGINTSAYSAADLKLSFGMLSTSIATSQLIVEQSTNGGSTWTPLSYTAPTAANSWTLVSISGGAIPSSTTLSLRFTQPSTATTPVSTQFRIDDVKVENVSASCTLSLGTPVVACVTSTSGLDNYTVTIPYTGGATATYTITTTGVVSGDNPTTTAAGNIIITMSESVTGTQSVTVSSSPTCTFTTNFTSPDNCIATNSLPVNEPFNYAVGTQLNTSQMWKNSSVGADEILAVSGNLTYTGITSTGNSVSFTGTGSDTLLPFTDTTSGDLFTSFLVKVSDLTGISTTGSTYFAVLTNASNAFTVARIYFKTDGTNFQYGISPTTTVADIVWSANTYAVNSTQYLVLRYDFTNNSLSLYENPTIGGSASPSVVVTPTTALTSLANFILRQDSATSTPAMTIDELTITTTPNFTLSSASFSQIDGLKMYPNPVKGGNLHIETASNGSIEVAIFDLVGKQVVSTKVVNNTVNVANLTTGVYVVKITEEGKTSTKKLVIE